MMSNYSLRRIMLLVILVFLMPLRLAVAESDSGENVYCEKRLTDAEIDRVFKQNALNQLAQEFGRDGSFVYQISRFPVDDLLVKVESYARYQKPGQKELSRMRLKAWVSRCNGTTIIRGNTWLADGSLKVIRYSEQELEGVGLQWGRKDAPMRFIVYVDSRCPHCHRLIDYAKKLVAQGKAFLDIRQVAYLEKKQEAILDTQLANTSLVIRRQPPVDDGTYLDMLGGNNSSDEIDPDSPEFKKALQLITQNTNTAEKRLHIVTVPGVLIQEKEYNNHYRKMGYWEVNRIFQ